MGRLIVIDGLDGSGKTTQFERLNAYFGEKIEHFRHICFPDYDQPSSALIKMYLAGEFGSSPDAVNAYAASSFYAVDRYASYKKFWQADYAAGYIFLAARYTTSNVIHQMSKLPRAEWDGYLAWIEDYEYRLLGLPKPDAVLFLDMPPAVSRRMLTDRYHGDENKKDIHERDEAYLERCREAALYAAARQGWQVVACSAGDEPLERDVITADMIARIESIL